MAFSPDAQAMSSQVVQNIARNSPQVARIISPPVADTTWPHTGQVMAGATRRRRHSLPQPIVPDTPCEKTGSRDTLSQHMNLDSSTNKHRQSSFPSNTCNPFTRNSIESSQSRTINGVTMELDYDPPSVSPQQINFGGSGGGGFESGIPFTRPPQLTLHSPTSNDGKSKASPSLGKSHTSSIAARKSARSLRICDFSAQPCRQHHFHERRVGHLHKVQLGTKRHLSTLDQDDGDADDDYTSSGPACKQYINEERMAARMNNLNISGNNSTMGSSFSSMWQAAPAHNSPPSYDWQNINKLPTFEELESRLSDSDPSEAEDESDVRIEYSPELRKVLKAKRNGPLPDVLARHVNPHCMQLVLWQPPSAIIEEKVKGVPSTIDEKSLASGPTKANYTKGFSDEASMECAMELPQLPTAPSTGSSSVRPASTGWGTTNVQLFDSVDDDDMDL